MRKFTWLLALAIPVTIISCQKDAVVSNEDDALVQGNLYGGGTLSGQHYNLNIIGVENPKNFNVDEQGNTTGNGRRIFVPLVGKARINLSMGPFDVLDADGTDGVAAFQLPEPDAQDDNVSDYSVYIRGLGKPGGSAKMKSCYDLDGGTYCSTDEYIVNISAHGNNNKFQNVTNQLLYVWVDLDGDGDVDDRVELFENSLADYYWEYANTGLRLAQMRFYPGVGTPIDPDPAAIQ